MFTKRELMLYEIIGAVSDSIPDIVFKGAMVTKLLLQKNNSIVLRETKDIDADLNCVNPPSMEQLTHILNNAIASLGNFTAIPFREYIENKQSAGFEVYYNGDLVTTIDLSLRKNPYYDIYSVGGISFRGSHIDKILCDKISAVSSNKIFRRTKDVIDIYALSSCVTFDYNEICKIAEQSKRAMGGFDAFINQKSELEHAYSKLKRVVEKPPFEEVYETVKLVLSPFIEKKKTLSLLWDPNIRQWKHLDLSSLVSNRDIVKDNKSSNSLLQSKKQNKENSEQVL